MTATSKQKLIHNHIKLIKLRNDTKREACTFFSSLPSDNSHIHVTIWLSNRRVKMRYEKKHYVTKGDNKPKSAPELHHECHRVTLQR